MADHEKVADGQTPEKQEVKLEHEAEELELAQSENESVELSEEELENVAGAGPKPSDDG